MYNLTVDIATFGSSSAQCESGFSALAHVVFSGELVCSGIAIALKFRGTNDFQDTI